MSGNPGYQVRAEIGYLMIKNVKHIGVIVEQRNAIVAFWTFETNIFGFIKELCEIKSDPDPQMAVGLGEMPGFDPEIFALLRDEDREWLRDACNDIRLPLIFQGIALSKEMAEEEVAPIFEEIRPFFPNAFFQAFIGERHSLEATEHRIELMEKFDFLKCPAIGVCVGPYVLRNGRQRLDAEENIRDISDLTNSSIVWPAH